MNAVVQLQDQLPSNPAELIFNDHAFGRLERVAQIMASGKATIPNHLRGSAGDCFAILLQSARWGMDPYAVAQKTHLTQSGSLGYEAQLINAVVINNAPIVGRPTYEFFGDWTKIIGKVEERKSDKGGKYYVAVWDKKLEDGLGVTCSCTLKGETEPRSIDVLLSQCWPRFSTQWATDPQQQITYAAIRKWARRYAPDVILGVYTHDELESGPERDMGEAVVVEKTQPKASSVKDKLRQRKEPVAETQAATVMARINAAETMEQLEAVAPDAGRLHEPFRSQARAAYKARKAELATTPPVDTKTGEIFDLTHQEWLERCEACANYDELEQVIASIPSEIRDSMTDQLAIVRDAFRD